MEDLKTEKISKEQCKYIDFFQYNPASRHRRRIIIELLKKIKFENVLDIGCGDGTLLDIVHDKFRVEVNGMDKEDSPAMERMANKIKTFIKMDIQNIDKLNQKYDLVICSEVLEHLENWEKGIKNLCLLSRKYVLITVPSGKIYRTDLWFGHYRHFKIDEIIKMLEKNNFMQVECFYWGFPFHTIYRWMLSIFPGMIMKNFGRQEYSFLSKIISEILYLIFFMNIRGIGKQIFILARKNNN